MAKRLGAGPRPGGTKRSTWSLRGADERVVETKEEKEEAHIGGTEHDRGFVRQAHMVFHYFHCVHPEPIFIRYSLKHFFSVLSNLTYQDVLPILGYPD